LGFYVQANWNTELAGMAFRGDFGVRQVTTDLTSEGVADVPSGEDEFVRENIIVERSYSKSLPSLNMALEPTDEVIVRLSAAKAITRPTLGSLTPGGKVDTFNGKVTYQNPYLDPFEANTFDIAVEYYFAEESLVSLAYFSKDIKSFISSSTEDVPYQNTGLPLDYLDGTNYGPSDIFEVKQ
jgi:TonB-dependent receptor